jgi:hypothetical protein
MTTQVKLQKKYVGRKVILADGTRTSIATMMATCFKTEEGTRLKVTELKELASGTLKQVAPGATKPAAKKPATRTPRTPKEEAPSTRRGTRAPKETPAARTTRTPKETPTTRRGSAASSRGRPATVETLDNYSDATRRQCQNYLKHVAEEFESIEDMSDYSLGELRIMCNEHLGVRVRKPKPKANEKVISSAKTIAASTKATVLDKVKEKTQNIKRRIQHVEEEVEKTTIAFSKFDQKLVDKLNKVILNRISPLIRTRTGLDVSLAVVYSMFDDRRCTVQIGFMPTDATDKEIRAYNNDVTTLNQEIEEEDIANTVHDFDDDLGEFDPSLDVEEAEELEETEDEEFDEVNESIDVDEIVSALTAQIGSKDKRIKSWIGSWFDTSEVEETFGEDVKIGTELVSNKTGNTLVVSGFDADKNKVVLYNMDEEKFTFAELVTVAKMDYAEDVAGADEEVEEEDDEEEFSE